MWGWEEEEGEKCADEAIYVEGLTATTVHGCLADIGRNHSPTGMWVCSAGENKNMSALGAA